MDTPAVFSLELLNAVKAHLDAGRFKEALELPEDNKYAAALKDNCWDLIPHLLGRIESDTIITWPALQRCCEKLLLIIAERANPEEVLLELIERAETAENDARFIAILKPLQVASLRASRRGRSLEWCLNTLHYYISKLPVPEDLDLTDKERLLLDCDENARRIIKIYTELPTFYDYFVDQISQNKCPSFMKTTMICFFIDLFGKPFACLDMEFNQRAQSQTCVVAETVFKNLCLIQDDLFIFLPYVQSKCHPSPKFDKDGVYEDVPDDLFLLDEKLPPICLGVLYYLLLSEQIVAPRLPQIYNPVYIYQEILPLVVVLLKQNENMIIYKGLKLAYALLMFLPDQASYKLLSVESNAFVKTLSTIAVYCPSELVRKNTVCLIKKYIMKFDDRGRYFIITNLYPTLEHSGIKGYIVNIYKDALIEAYHGEDIRLSWFSEKNLNNALRLFCKLNNGAETDLVDSADHVISTLNLLRFLVLKDASNKTGIFKYLKSIESQFLVPLREGIDLARAHYEMKLIDLSNYNSEKIPKISVQVGGSLLDSLPVQNKKDVINSGLNALHLIDSLLSRLQECTSARLFSQNYRPTISSWRPSHSSHSSEAKNEQNSSANSEPKPSNGNTGSQKESIEEQVYLKEIENKILSAAIQFVPELGWSKEALGKGAQAVGYVSAIHSMFPHGSAHIVDHFTRSCNDILADKFSKMTISIDEKNRLKFIEDSIVDRIQLIQPHKNSWNDALAKIMNSKLAPKHLQNILKLSDDICYYAGDRSVDINWYVRRVGIATIYQASEIHWLGNSRSPEECIEDMRRFTASQLKCAAAVNDIPDKLSALLTIATNIIPLNWKR